MVTPNSKLREIFHRTEIDQLFEQMYSLYVAIGLKKQNLLKFALLLENIYEKCEGLPPHLLQHERRRLVQVLNSKYEDSITPAQWAILNYKTVIIDKLFDDMTSTSLKNNITLIETKRGVTAFASGTKTKPNLRLID